MTSINTCELMTSNVRKSFGAECVLDGATITLRPGECAGLIGRSGAGKTVLARCIVGLERMDAGEIRLGDLLAHRNIRRFDSVWIAIRRQVGYVSQSKWLPPYRKIIDQIIEGPRYSLGLSIEECMERARPWIDRLDLRSHLEKYPSLISGGQLARVCLARALALGPSYLICDEITSNLEPPLAGEVLEYLLELVRSGLGVLLVSHQMTFLRRHTSRVHFLNKGIIACTGTPSEMLDNPADECLRDLVSAIERGR